MTDTTQRPTPTSPDALLELPLVVATCSPDERKRLKEIVEELPMDILKQVLAANRTLSEVDRNILHDAFVKHKACHACNA